MVCSVCPTGVYTSHILRINRYVQPNMYADTQCITNRTMCLSAVCASALFSHATSVALWMLSRQSTTLVKTEISQQELYG